MTEPFTTDEIKSLAAIERMMDKGEIPFVMLGGQRVSVRPEGMTALGLEQGQTITDQIMIAILEWNIADLEARITLQAAKH